MPRLNSVLIGSSELEHLSRGKLINHHLPLYQHYTLKNGLMPPRYYARKIAWCQMKIACFSLALWERFGSFATLIRVMACCPMEPSHYQTSMDYRKKDVTPFLNQWSLHLSCTKPLMCDVMYNWISQNVTPNYAYIYIDHNPLLHVYQS